MSHLETSIPGLAVIICGVILFAIGKTNESTLAAGAMVATGLGLLRAADASKSVEKRGPDAD